MTRRVAALAAASLLAACRTAGVPPGVRVSIVPSTPASQPLDDAAPGLFRKHRIELATLLAYAHLDDNGRVEFDSPRAHDLYDVDIRAPGADEARMHLLALDALQAVFPHTAVPETREADALELVDAGAPGASRRPPKDTAGSGGGMSGDGSQFGLSNATPEELAEMIEQLGDTPVYDKTGDARRYDMEVRWDPKDPASLGKALEEQLGYRLVRARAPLTFLVIHEKKKSP